LLKLKEMLGSLPEINRDLATALFKLLCDVAKNVEFNSMGTDNLASMNAPNILNSKTFDLEAIMKANQVVKVIIENFDYFFTALEKEEIFDLNSSVCYTEDCDELSEMSAFDQDDLEIVDFESKCVTGNVVDVLDDA
jgi:protein-tyrosine-phosphatase